ncbi:hypothetical protein QZH41_018260 [Actinostola sp. cb2023]|nr:hypothetical protein QZH41_018260 [Actinostola sp. cb2023]
MIFGDHFKTFIMNIFQGLSQLIWGSEQEPLLNEAQITLIRDSWREVEQGDLQETGVIMFTSDVTFSLFMSPRYHIVDNRKNVSVNHRNPNLLMSQKNAKRVITTGSLVSAVLPCSKLEKRFNYTPFDRLFKIAPYLRDLFPFGHNPDSRGLTIHALGVMKTVGVAVKELDNPATLKVKLIELGAAHKPFELTDKEFQHVGAALLWTLEQGLGDEFTPDVNNAWTAAYGFIQDTMKEGLK